MKLIVVIELSFRRARAAGRVGSSSSTSDASPAPRSCQWEYNYCDTQLKAPHLSTTAIDAFRRDLRVLERQVVRQMQVETACCGVTLAQCHVLPELGQAGSLSLRDLAERQGLDKHTLSRTVEGLVKVGLVHRLIDAADRRAVKLTCTRAGTARAAEIDAACNRKYAALLARASAPQRRQIIDAVRVLAAAMQDERATCGDGAAACCGAPVPAPATRRPPRVPTAPPARAADRVTR